VVIPKLPGVKAPKKASGPDETRHKVPFFKEKII
jgi:hypothetical protein